MRSGTSNARFFLQQGALPHERRRRLPARESPRATGRDVMARSVAEKGLPDWVIQAQVGHVAPEMMKTYSHIRRQALSQAADALEPNAPVPAAQSTPRTHRARVMSQSTSQSGRPTGRVLRFVREVGSSGWIRAESRPACGSRECLKTGRGGQLRETKLAPRAGFEPATLRLTAGCSAVELPRNRQDARPLRASARTRETSS